MNKARLEALSDAVFAIVMTVLILSVYIPKVADGAYLSFNIIPHTLGDIERICGLEIR